MLVRDVGQEGGLHLQNGVEIEAADVQQVGHRSAAVIDAADARPRIHAHQPPAERGFSMTYRG